MSVRPPGRRKHRSTYHGERQHIVFEAIRGKKHLAVLAGAAGAPTPTGGYAKWLEVPRPQRNPITVLEGFEATTLSIPLTFSLITGLSERGEVQRRTPEEVEEAIWWLEDAAGLTRKRYTPKLQLLKIYTVDGKGVQIPLLPPGPIARVQDVAKTFWVIDGIAWDSKPERNSRGYRIRQDGTVTVKEWVPTPREESAVKGMRAKLERDKPTVIRSTAALNTIRRIAAYYGSPTPEAWKEILKANRGNRRVGTSATKHLPPGTKVILPAVIAR